MRSTSIIFRIEIFPCCPFTCKAQRTEESTARLATIQYIYDVMQYSTWVIVQKPDKSHCSSDELQLYPSEQNSGTLFLYLRVYFTPDL